MGRGNERPVVSGHHWVPIDDETFMVWNWHYSYGEYELSEPERLMDSSGNGPRHVDPNNGYRATGNRRNGWLIDHEVQRTQTFSGIDGVNAQDRAVKESMGPIVDRSREHLGPADRAIIAARKLLIEAVRTVQDGAQPRGAGTSYYNVRASEKILPRASDWREVMLPEMHPSGEAIKAESFVE